MAAVVVCFFEAAPEVPEKRDHRERASSAQHHRGDRPPSLGHASHRQRAMCGGGLVVEVEAVVVEVAPSSRQCTATKVATND